ncbi:MAG: hypothetical protein R6W06_09970 [Prochlorococcaceae cyanobacterium]
MGRPYCTTCRQRPEKVVLLRSGIAVCRRCGSVLEAGPVLPLLPALGALLLGAGVALAVMPRLDQPQSKGQPRPAQPSPSAPQARQLPAAEPAAATLQPERLQGQLAEADRQWIPRAEPLPDGGYRYQYKRRAGEPELDLEQIRALIADPPSFAREQQLISRLLLSLQQVGVQVSLSEPRKQGAAGEWDPARRALRIQPRVVEKGSLDFAHVLNHEAIHVAQSCRGGGVAKPPKPLGLSTDLSAELEGHLAEPVYARASALEQQLEREAYANQHNLELGLILLRAHCGMR